MTVAELMKRLTELPLEAVIYVEGADRAERPALAALGWMPYEKATPCAKGEARFPPYVLITSHDYDDNIPPGTAIPT